MPMKSAMPCFEHPLAHVGVEPAHDRDRDGDLLLDAGGKEGVGTRPQLLGVVLLGEVLQRDGRIGVEEQVGEIPGNVVAEPVAPHHDGVGPGLLQPAGVLAGDLRGEHLAVFEAQDLADLEAVDDDGAGEVLAAAALDLGDHLAGKAGAVLARAAVDVGAAIPERGQEVVEQVAAGSVDVDAVEARLLGPLRRRGELVHQALYLRDGDLARDLVVEVGHAGHRDRRGAQGRPGEHLVRLDVGQIDLPGTVVVHLHEGRAAMLVHDVHQFLHPLDEAVVVDAVALRQRAPAG